MIDSYNYNNMGVPKDPFVSDYTRDIGFPFSRTSVT